jgi:hypothetical protein
VSVLQTLQCAPARGFVAACEEVVNRDPVMFGCISTCNKVMSPGFLLAVLVGVTDAAFCINLLCYEIFMEKREC